VAVDTADAPPLVLRDVALIDGTGAAPVVGATVCVAGGQIARVAAAGEAVPVPAGARVVDGAGMTLLLGLIDAHVHAYPGMWPLFLRFGVTTVRDVGQDPAYLLAELVRGDLGEAVRRLKREPGKGLLVGGVKLPLALADLGLLDAYEFVVQPILAGHGPTVFAGLSERLELRLVGRQEFRAGAVALRYQPSRGTA
jgi:RibD C-terminal domain